jgi:hypothetical protein
MARAQILMQRWSLFGTKGRINTRAGSGRSWRLVRWRETAFISAQDADGLKAVAAF